MNHYILNRNKIFLKSNSLKNIKIKIKKIKNKKLN
jgi:hypothetical protein